MPHIREAGLRPQLVELTGAYATAKRYGVRLSRPRHGKVAVMEARAKGIAPAYALTTPPQHARPISDRELLSLFVSGNLTAILDKLVDAKAIAKCERRAILAGCRKVVHEASLRRNVKQLPGGRRTREHNPYANVGGGGLAREFLKMVG